MKLQSMKKNANEKTLDESVTVSNVTHCFEG